MNMKKELKWKADLPLLLKEILEYNKWMEQFKIPFNILQSILSELVQRAIELNDKELNKIMIRLALYEWSHSKEMQDYLTNK